MYNLDAFYKKIPKAWYDDITEYTYTTELSQTHLYLLHSLALELIDFVFTYKSNVRLIYSKELNDNGFEYFICPKPSGQYVSIDFQMDENQELVFDNLGSKTGILTTDRLYLYLWQVLSQFARSRNADYLLYKTYDYRVIELYTNTNYTKLESLRTI